MINVSHLTKRYGPKTAVNDISFSVKRGEIVGFLGPNGAGKSTTMNLLTGYLSSNEGDISIAGFDILEEPLQAKQHIGYLPEKPPLYPGMTVDSYLKFVCRLKNIPKKETVEQIETVSKKAGITAVRERLISNLSKGYCQRVGIAQALIGNPEVLILDEPTVGLDPNQIIEIRSLIAQLGKEHTVILSSHILSEVQAVCDRIIILNNGRIIADGNEENLSKETQGNNSLVLRVMGKEKEVSSVLDSISDIGSYTKQVSPEPGSCEFRIYPPEGKDVRKEIGVVLFAQGLPILELHKDETSLEDIFLQLIASDNSENPLKEERGDN